jgi:hypothetical protein
MIRRVVLAAVALTLTGGIAAPAFADVLSSSSGNDYVCVLGTNKTTGVRDGICVWIPSNIK